MMRGSKAMAVSVRNPDGEIVTHVEPLNQNVYGGKIARLPFLRGLTLLWDALGLGIKALMFSAEIAIEEEGEEGESAEEVFSAPMQYGTIGLSLAMGIGLFFLLPAFLAGLLESWLGLTGSPLWGNLFEGLIRLVLLISYISLIGLLADIRRLYGYHGAEHKTINAYEAGAELTPESVSKFSLQHPRCGTAFLLTVVIISILLYSLFPRLSLFWRVLSRLALLPLIAGIAYEILRFTAKHRTNPLIRILIAPNLALQKLTTREPDISMLEVAICSFNYMLMVERGEKLAETPHLFTIGIGHPGV